MRIQFSPFPSPEVDSVRLESLESRSAFYRRLQDVMQTPDRLGTQLRRTD